jgi:hypothetical protein
VALPGYPRGCVRRAHSCLRACRFYGVGGGLWNTGVWPGWGTGDRAVLNWAARGVVVDKQCPVRCDITTDQSRINEADVVLMELVNHLKFLGAEKAATTPVQWPAKRADGLPLVGNFYFEPTTSFKDYTTSPDVLAHVDFTLAPSQKSTIPVSLVCPWGHAAEDFLLPPPPKTAERSIVYFNEHGVAGTPCSPSACVIEPICCRAYNCCMNHALHAWRARRSMLLREAAGSVSRFE